MKIHKINTKKKKKKKKQKMKMKNVIKVIENVRTNGKYNGDKPVEDVKIISISIKE